MTRRCVLKGVCHRKRLGGNSTEEHGDGNTGSGCVFLFQFTGQTLSGSVPFSFGAQKLATENRYVLAVRKGKLVPLETDTLDFECGCGEMRILAALT